MEKEEFLKANQGGILLKDVPDAEQKKDLIEMLNNKHQGAYNTEFYNIYILRQIEIKKNGSTLKYVNFDDFVKASKETSNGSDLSESDLLDKILNTLHEQGLEAILSVSYNI